MRPPSPAAATTSGAAAPRSRTKSASPPGRRHRSVEAGKKYGPTKRRPNWVLKRLDQLYRLPRDASGRCMSNVDTFKKGQVVWALWQTFSVHNARDPRRAEIPAPFATRVRKLQEFGVPLPPDARPGRAGTDAQYTPYQVFEIAVGLALQDNGLPQAEIGFFLRNLRPKLQEVYASILASPAMPSALLAGMSLAPPKDRPVSPPGLDPLHRGHDGLAGGSREAGTG